MSRKICSFFENNFLAAPASFPKILLAAGGAEGKEKHFSDKKGGNLSGS
ncbi:MAG: hypothetical protein ACYDIC_05455 [Desulfobaccales bacterium]